jgi:hypothetical protein
MLRHWQLLAAVMWGVMAVAVLLRGALFPAESLDRVPVRNWTVANLICGLLAIWNVARWYQGVQSRGEKPLRPALQPKPDARGGYEYNPDLDFQKMDREQRADGA